MRDRRDQKERVTTTWLHKQNKSAQIDQNLKVWRLENPYQPRRRKTVNAQDVFDRYDKGRKVEEQD